MASNTPNVSGIKQWLRFKNLEELRELSDSIAALACEEVTITGTSAEGGSANGEVAFPRLDYLDVVMAVRREKGDVPLNADGTVTSRQLGTRADYSRTVSVT
jgi:hypothetical protein